MFDVLIYCSACQRHQVWIRYSGDLRDEVAGLYDNDLEPARIEAEYGEIVDLVKWPPPGCQNYGYSIHVHHGFSLQRVVRRHPLSDPSRHRNTGACRVAPGPAW